MPTPLTDAQLDVLFRAALPFQPATRVQFLEAVMSALSKNHHHRRRRRCLATIWCTE